MTQKDRAIASTLHLVEIYLLSLLVPSTISLNTKVSNLIQRFQVFDRNLQTGINILTNLTQSFHHLFILQYNIHNGSLKEIT